MSEAGRLPGADLSGLPDRGLAVVGFSGGADSAALAHWLKEAVGAQRVVLAHVNHMLRGEEADRDEAAAREFAGRLGLRFVFLRADVRALAEERGMGLEACGRAVRYEFLESLAPGEDDRILTAHNADDNAETILLNLCRGTGLSGLCGIPRQRGKILRPLLGVTREEIEAYCAHWGLPYVTDSTNLSDEYSRNRIRHGVVPVLRELNPQFLRSAAQTAALLSRDRDYIRAGAEELLQKVTRKHGLDGAALLEAPESLRTAAVKRYLEEQGCRDLTAKHLELALALLESGGSVSLTGGVQAGFSQGIFWAEKRRETEGFSVPVTPGETLLPDGRRLILRVEEAEAGKIHNSFFKNALDYDIITGNLAAGAGLTARTRKAGDRFSPAGRRVTKPLKQLFQEQRIPACRREELLLLECGGELAFCEEVGVSRKFCVTGETRRRMTVEIREPRTGGN